MSDRSGFLRSFKSESAGGGLRDLTEGSRSKDLAQPWQRGAASCAALPLIFSVISPQRQEARRMRAARRYLRQRLRSFGPACNNTATVAQTSTFLADAGGTPSRTIPRTAVTQASSSRRQAFWRRRTNRG